MVKTCVRIVLTMRAEYRIYHYRDEISGLVKFPGARFETAAIKLIRSGGEWVVGASITLGTDLKQAEVVAECFQAAMQAARLAGE